MAISLRSHPPGPQEFRVALRTAPQKLPRTKHKCKFSVPLPVFLKDACVGVELFTISWHFCHPVHDGVIYEIIIECPVVRHGGLLSTRD